MKKYILIASIAIIAVLNFTLVKSKTGEVTLKSLTELAQANADGEHPDQIISFSRINTGSFSRSYSSNCMTCGSSYAQERQYFDNFRNITKMYRWNGTEYVYEEVIYDGEAITERWNICYASYGAHNYCFWKRNPPIQYIP